MEPNIKRRSGGRSAKSERKAIKSIEQMKWKIPYNTDNFIEPLDDEGVSAIDNAAMQVIEEIGVEFLNDEAISILKEAGCIIKNGSYNVKMDRAGVSEMISKAPSEFDIIPRGA